MPLTYAEALDYLLDLGRRHLEIGRAELSFTGEASGTLPYPLLLVEGDCQGSETTPGLDTLTIAVQVLGQLERPTTDTLAALLARANGWADELTQQLRDELPGQLGAVNKLALPGQAGSDLACGWRLELTLKIAKNLDRTTNAARFAPRPL